MSNIIIIMFIKELKYTIINNGDDYGNTIINRFFY